MLLPLVLIAASADANTAEQVARAIEAERRGPNPDIRVTVSDRVAVVTGRTATGLESRRIEHRLRDASDVDTVLNLVVFDRP